MKIKIQKTLTIQDETEWFIAAPPQKGIAQWKDGKSAKEFAKYVTLGSKEFKAQIARIIKNSFGITVKSLVGEPEAETKLPPKDASGPRNHDLLLFDDNNEIVIGIEAKVDEPFGDKSIYEEREKASTKKKNRIDWLMEMLLPGKFIGDEEVKNFGYQLFTATAGTLLEARRRGVSRCIFVVLSFHNENEPKKNDNIKAFRAFVKLVCGKDLNHKKFKVSDECMGEAEEKEIDCCFVMEEVRIHNPWYDHPSPK